MSENGLTQWRRKQVGFVFQSFGLLPTLTAYENVELMLRIAGAAGKKRRERTTYCLEIVGLKKWMHHRPYEMSGGQQQRVAIARALVNEPAIILADEPTGNLDTRSGEEIMHLLLSLNRESGTTLIIVTHDPDVATQTQRSIHIRDGVVEE